MTEILQLTLEGCGKQVVVVLFKVLHNLFLEGLREIAKILHLPVESRIRADFTLKDTASVSH
jgi:hypothetical protein